MQVNRVARSQTGRYCDVSESIEFWSSKVVVERREPRDILRESSWTRQLARTMLLPQLGRGLGRQSHGYQEDVSARSGCSPLHHCACDTGWRKYAASWWTSRIRRHRPWCAHATWSELGHAGRLDTTSILRQEAYSLECPWIGAPGLGPRRYSSLQACEGRPYLVQMARLDTGCP
jgi:hypothetical protein